MRMTAAVVLAAGGSSRMGSSKGLLQAGGVSLIGHMTGLLLSQGFQPLWVIVGADADAYAKALPPSGFHYVTNRDWKLGRTLSVKMGLKLVEQRKEGILVWPVDHPFVTGETLLSLRDAFVRGRKEWVVPTHRSKRGHPPILGPAAADEVGGYGDDEPLNRYPREHPQNVLEVEVDDPGILENIDTPQDLRLAMDKRRGV